MSTLSVSTMHGQTNIKLARSSKDAITIIVHMCVIYNKITFNACVITILLYYYLLHSCFT